MLDCFEEIENNKNLKNRSSKQLPVSSTSNINHPFSELFDVERFDQEDQIPKQIDIEDFSIMY